MHMPTNSPAILKTIGIEREDKNMQLPMAIRMMAIAVMLTLGSTALHAQQTWTPLPESQRCPSKWGAGDQRGSGNWMKPETVLRATKLIHTGETFELSFVLSPDMPIIGNRVYDLVTQYPGKSQKPNAGGSLTEIVISEIGQVGTQFDGFAHQMIGGTFYNCFKLDDIATPNGLAKLGMENVGTLMTRGVLIDVAALKGVEMLGETYAITAEDLQQALAREKMTLQPGDAVIINTGWAKLYNTDKVKYLKTSPGIGLGAVQWLLKQEPMLIGADNCCVEARYPGQPPALHPMMIAENGMHLIENLRLDQVAAARVYEFAFIVEPLKLKGATGSTVAPVAIH
jgi:kynurenine formamidase